jgi:hypothetical protein
VTNVARQFKAQERYAQETLDYLWDNAEDICVANADGVFYQGSLHMLIGRIRPSAQRGDVVNILRESGSIANAGHALWELRRRQIFEDEEGNPVEFDAQTYGHDSKKTIDARNLQALNDRVSQLEDEVTALKAIVIGWAHEKELHVGVLGDETPNERSNQESTEGERNQFE